MNDKMPSMSLRSPTLHFTIWLLLTAFVTMIVVAFVFKIEVVAIGTGKVVPLSRVQVIQSEFSGKITDIAVKNGDRVKRGDVLVSLDRTEAETDLAVLSEESARLEIEAKRLTALLDALQSAQHNPTREDLSGFAKEIASADFPEFASVQTTLLASEIGALESALAESQSANKVAQANLNVAFAQKDRLYASLEIAQERLEIVNKLREGGNSSRFSQLDAVDETGRLEKEMHVLGQEIIGLQAEIDGIAASRTAQISRQIEAGRDRLADISARNSTIRQDMKVAGRRLGAAHLVAPLDGVVHKLEVYTIGGIAEAGQELMQIVPSDADLDIEAVLTNTDIGFVEVGQPVNLKFDAYPSERFGHLKGTVSKVSADTSEVTDNVWGYTINITPQERQLVSGSLVNDIRPGMTVEVNIITEKRRLITYFFAPIVKTFSSALGER